MKKIAKEIKIINKKIGTFHFFKNDFSIIKKMEEKIIKSIKNLKRFYNTNISDIDIELIYSRKEFNKKIGRNATPDWLVGFTHKNKIYLFSPSIIEKYSSHKKTDLYKIISHELCHIFNTKINKKMPIWLNEGIALYLSKQKKQKGFKKSDWQFFADNVNKKLSFNSFIKHDGYKISYHIMKNLANNYNKKNLLRLIKKPSLVKREDLRR